MTAGAEASTASPSSRRTVDVGSLGEFVNGYPFRPDDWVKEGGRPIIRIQNLTDPSKPLNRYLGNLSERYRVRAGDLLISWSASLDAFIWKGEEAWLNQHIFKVTPDESVVDSDYLYFLMKREIRQIAKSARGSTMKHVTGKIFRQHRVELPALDEQRRTARVLATIQRAKEASKAVSAALSTARAALFHFVLSAPDWPVVRLGDVMTLQRGHDLPSQARESGVVPVISSSGITGFHSEAKAEGPGVVIGRYGTLGKVHYVDGPYWPLNTTLYVKDFHGNEPRFVRFFLETLAYEDHNDKTSVPGINRNDLHRLSVAWPPLPDQRRIALEVEALDRTIVAEEKTRAAVNEVFDAAATALFGGSE